MLPRKPRESPVLPPQDRKGEPKHTDPEDRDLLVAEGGTIKTPPPGRLVTGRLDWRRASLTRFAYDATLGKGPSIWASLIEGTLAISP
jgi:hypothetical protein